MSFVRNTCGARVGLAIACATMPAMAATLTNSPLSFAANHSDFLEIFPPTNSIATANVVNPISATLQNDSSAIDVNSLDASRQSSSGSETPGVTSLFTYTPSQVTFAANLSVDSNLLESAVASAELATAGGMSSSSVAISDDAASLRTQSVATGVIDNLASGAATAAASASAATTTVTTSPEPSWLGLLSAGLLALTRRRSAMQ